VRKADCEVPRRRAAEAVWVDTKPALYLPESDALLLSRSSDGMAVLLTKALHRLLMALLKLDAMMPGKSDSRGRPQWQRCGSDDGAERTTNAEARDDETRHRT